MATGGKWTYKRLILSVLVCVARGAYGSRHPKFEAVYTSGNNKGDVVVAGEETQLEVWGSGFFWGLQTGLTFVHGVQGGPCGNLITPPITPDALTHTHATFTLLPAHTEKIPILNKIEMWLCTRDRSHLGGGRSRHMGGWVHQGSVSRLLLVPSLQRTSHRLSLRSAERPPPLVEMEGSVTMSTVLQSNKSNAANAPVAGNGAKDTSGTESIEGDSDSVVPDKPSGELLLQADRTGGSVLGDGTVGGNTGGDSGAGGGDNIEVPSTGGMIRGSDTLEKLDSAVEKGELGVWEGVTVRSEDLTTTVMEEIPERPLVAAPNLDVMLGDMPVNNDDGNADGVRTTTTLKDEMVKEEITDKPRTSRIDKMKEDESRNSGLDEVNMSDSVMGMMKESISDDDSSVGTPTDGVFDPVGVATPLPGTLSDDNSQMIKVTGLRVESHSKGISYEDFSGSILVDTDADVRFFGYGFTESTEFLFTSYEQEYGSQCDAATTKFFKVNDVGNGWAIATVSLPPMNADQSRWYLCARITPEAGIYHQGTASWITLKSFKLILPFWLQASFIFVLLCLSGLFSGLNLGLMALDKTELKIVINTGSPIERRHARAIEPIRAHGNFLLCTLLLGNVLVNSSLTILLDELSSGLVAVIGSTIGIVIFGEIIPQAVCSRHGLAVGARTSWLVRVFMVLTGPISYPISKLLDMALGEEIGNTYNRERLKELIRVTQDHNDLKMEEQNIICGALEFHKKTVGEVMTKLEDIYMLSVEAYLDFETINEMMQQGFSRVPVYEGEVTNIISVLFIKDLAFIDPDDHTPLKTLCQFYQNPLNFVFVDTTLDLMLKDFKEGSKGHMAFVQKVNNEGDCDPFYEVVGLVTLEDVIEELIQEEIIDETDVFTDNRSKRRRLIRCRRDFTQFSQPGAQAHHRKVQISPQMQLAAFQYLRTTVDPFKEGQLSEVILKKLINQDVVHCVKIGTKELSKSDQQSYIFAQGKQVDYFVLILEGHVEVFIGKEGLTFESGPFTYFGLAAVSQSATIGESPSASTQLSKGSMRGSVQSLDNTKFSFIPDYSVRAITEVLYLKIRRSHYIAARRAFLLEQSQKEPHSENFEKEMAKMWKDDEDLVSPLQWDSTAPTSKESSGMPNGSAGQDFGGNSMETNNHIYPSSPALNSSIKNSVSVPGTPLSNHSQFSMKPSTSFTNLQEFGTSVSSINVELVHSDNQNSAVKFPLTNNLSESSIEDNGEQKVIGSPDVMPNMGRHMSLDYKQSNLDNEGVMTHRRESSFS